MSTKKLNARQRLFVERYLIHKNGTQAAIEAGYSKKTAQEIASQNLSKVIIAEAIESGLQRQLKKSEITAEKVLNRIAHFAFEDSEYGIRAGDALKACELLGKNLKLFTDVVESKIEANVAVVDEAQAKAVLEKIRNDC